MKNIRKLLFKREAILVIITMATALILLVVAGCGSTETMQKFSINLNKETYQRESIDNVLQFTYEHISEWTGKSQEVALSLLGGDYERAWVLIFNDIVNLDPNQADQIIWYIDMPPLKRLFYDPRRIFQLFKDVDRSGWTDDEKAAADLIIALTYENGDYEGAIEGWEGGGYPIEVIPELDRMAKESYEKIAENYKDSEIAFVAELLLLDLTFRQNEDARALLTEAESLRDEIEAFLQNSTFSTKVQFAIAAAYRLMGDYENAILQLERILSLPDLYTNFDLTDPESSAHNKAEALIEDFGGM